MIIDLKNLPSLEHHNFKEGKGVFIAHTYFDGKTKIMLGKLPPGSSIGYHTHTDDSEVITCISGVGNVVLKEGNETLRPGNVHYCPKGESHSLENNGTEDLTVYAIVTR